MDWFEEASGFDFEYSIGAKNIFFLSLYLCLAQS